MNPPEIITFLVILGVGILFAKIVLSQLQ